MSWILLVRPADAHPHAWIDVQSALLMDQGGQIIGIEQEWLFDRFYTVFILENLPDSGEELQKGLEVLAKGNLASLREDDYFIEAVVDGSKVSLSTVSKFDTELREGRLWMRFSVPLERPVDASGVEFSYAIYDPSYYIEILHEKGARIAFKGENPKRCVGKIVPPDPDFDIIAFAQSLDRGAEAVDTLGRSFAEWVEISCPWYNVGF